MRSASMWYLVFSLFDFHVVVRMVIEDVSGQPLVLDVQLVLEHLLLILGIEC